MSKESFANDNSSNPINQSDFAMKKLKNEQNNIEQNNIEQNNIEQINQAAETVKVHLYKIETATAEYDMMRGWGVLLDEIFIPSLKVCVNFYRGNINIIKSNYRRSDYLEYEKMEFPTFLRNPKYYVHTETEIPMELYKKIEQIVNMKNQIETITKELNPLEQFICNSPNEQAEYTNPMVMDEKNLEEYKINYINDQKKKKNKHHDSN